MVGSQETRPNGYHQKGKFFSTPPLPPPYKLAASLSNVPLITNHRTPVAYTGASEWRSLSLEALKLELEKDQSMIAAPQIDSPTKRADEARLQCETRKAKYSQKLMLRVHLYICTPRRRAAALDSERGRRCEGFQEESAHAKTKTKHPGRGVIDLGACHRPIWKSNRRGRNCLPRKPPWKRRSWPR